MFERLSRSWGLMKASAAVLRADKALVVFPLISTAAVVVVIACFAIPMFGLGALDKMSGPNGAVSTLTYVVAFLFYTAQYFVIFFFNTALVGAAMMRLDGKDPTVGDGLRIASSKFVNILGYALIAATVGMVLRAIQERVGFIGRIIVGLLGVGWTIATFMVVPVLAARDVGPIDAIKESATLLKDTWGENVIGQVGLGAAFGLMLMGVMFVGITLIVVAAFSHSLIVVGVAIVALVLAVVILSLVQAALGGIYSAALYRYATTGKGSEGFQAESLKLAFAPKK
jgi:Family of unknown function (DUF6159)